MPALRGVPRSSTATGCRSSASTTRTPSPTARWRWSQRDRGDLPLLADPRRRPDGAGAVPGLRGLPFFAFVDADGQGRPPGRPAASSRSSRWSRSSTSTSGSTCERARVDAARACPTGCGPSSRPRASITVHDLTRFMPPRGRRPPPRRGADALRRGTPTATASCCSPSAPTTCAPTPARCPSRAARIDAGETPVEAALREAHEETGLDPAGVEVFGELPELWLPPSNFAVTPVLGWWRDPGEVAHRRPRRGPRDLPRRRSASCSTPTHRITVRHPSGWLGPGFLIGDDKRRHPVGLHRRHHRPALRLPRLGTGLGRRRRCVTCPTYMLQGEPRHRPDPSPNTRFEERR